MLMCCERTDLAIKHVHNGPKNSAAITYISCIHRWHGASHGLNLQV